MNSRSRLRAAMNMAMPDRVPLMCQLSIGFYFLHASPDPRQIWLTSEGFASALIELADRFHFDGILVNLPGRPPDLGQYIDRIEESDQMTIHWKNGHYTEIPPDDNPHYYQPDGQRYFPGFREIDPERLFYVEPWDITEITDPYTWAFEEEPRPEEAYFPEYHLDTFKMVIGRAGNRLSIHSEVFSPWSQFLELLNYDEALLAILDDPEKCRACLDRLADGAIALGAEQIGAGADAVLISSAFAGAGFISREHYEKFVLPYERKVIRGLHAIADVPVYTHTCGAIGDRLDLMLETGTDGIDTLDPPPIGTVELEDAVDQLSGEAFIKGNIDPINTLLNGNPSTVKEDARWRLNTAMPGGGYILSSACAVAPHTPTENLHALFEAAEEFGHYS